MISLDKLGSHQSSQAPITTHTADPGGQDGHRLVGNMAEQQLLVEPAHLGEIVGADSSGSLINGRVMQYLSSSWHEPAKAHARTGWPTRSGDPYGPNDARNQWMARGFVNFPWQP
jgi:hypothetical protein